ncbi:MAG: hypothetical protein Q4C63_04190, partial [Eubacteriales bacterium]|nr:hypothetical protein [Eubacteriales bacterium]
QRRALNMIWTAAEDYDFDPEFIAYLQNGQPDAYMNAVIGYVHKWYDPKIMARLFSAFDQTLLSEVYNGLLWIALEKAVYEKEVRERPVLTELRIAYAKQFFETQRDKSRQQWMAQNSLVYTLQADRWRRVLGRPGRIILPWKKRLLNELLSYNGEMDAQAILTRTLAIYRRYFFFNEEGARRRIHLRIKGVLGNLLARTPSGQVVRNDMLEIGMNARGGGGGHLSDAKAGETVDADPERDLAYIENCFGMPMFDRESSLQLEHKLCTGNHTPCHLYFTNGAAGKKSTDPLFQKVSADAAAQRKKNRSYYQLHQKLYEGGIRRLSAQLKNTILVYSQPDIIRGKSGMLSARDIWRGLYLNDPRVFLERQEQNRSGFSVDLMLDASASRMGYQEVIAAQAYMIAKSLHSCHIPVQVYSFCSLRGYTVMRLLSRSEDCALRESGSAGSGQTSGRTVDTANGGIEASGDRFSGIFDYYAAGWNRDGLALRGAAELIRREDSLKHLLIVLTDASPNDDRLVPPTDENHLLVARSYAGEIGIKDTAEEVKALRKDHIKVAAILNGDHCAAEDARQIYGDHFVHIQKLEQLSEAVGKLLTEEITGGAE